MKVFRWIDDNILLLLSLFFLVFIPLYPKLPLIGISHVFVYIRIEDFLVTFAVLIYLIQLLRKKAKYKSALTIPIFIFWGIGLLGTVLALIFIFPHLQDPSLTGDPHVYIRNALLFYARHIEYISLFFIAYASIHDKKQIKPIIIVLSLTLLAVVIYGIGQRYTPKYFPAFSTMNEEFAKGIPLQLSPYGRVQSTFAGHYDLAAYLVLIIPIIASMIFGVKKWWAKVALFFVAYGGLILLLLTASRVSFAMYLVSMIFLLTLQKQKKFIIPVIVFSILTLSMFQGISSRYLGTISSVDLVVDARTGKPIGIATQSKGKKAVIVSVTSTGENLPAGSGYLGNAGQTAKAQVDEIVFQRLKPQQGKNIPEITQVKGNYVIKKALAYDVSFTTRFQGEWPRALDALRRNYFFGSGYSSISAATDNNYLRMLGETGVLGFVAFLSIFLILGIYSKKILPHIESAGARAFVIGTLAGLLGLSINAVLIDVFEASKVAFVMWTVVGLMIGILHLYQEKKIQYRVEIINFFRQKGVLITALLVGTFAMFGGLANSFFVADDFIWLRGVADCLRPGLPCPAPLPTILGFFTNAHNFFYRPGIQTYFYFMYGVFTLKPMAYHIVSFLLHFGITAMLFLLARRIVKHTGLAFLSALAFLLTSVHFETVVWISAVNHLFATFFIVLSLYFSVLWAENRKWYFLGASFFAAITGTFFHEYAIIAPVLIIVYDIVNQKSQGVKSIISRWYYYLFLLVIPIDILLRSIAHSVWAQADYRYNLTKLPFNTLGNSFGYLLVSLFGTGSLGFYDQTRAFLKNNLPLSTAIVVLAIAVIIFISLRVKKRMGKDSQRIFLNALIFFAIPLLPFLALGNITARYDYLAVFGVIVAVMYGGFLLWNHRGVKRFTLAKVLVVILAVTFVFLQYKDNKNLRHDWTGSTQITYNLLQDMNVAYGGPDTLPPESTFYFVNTPIKYGQAWVFPVGLQDAIWFTFQDTIVHVEQANSVTDAFDISNKIPVRHIFLFQKDGTITEVFKLPAGTPLPK